MNIQYILCVKCVKLPNHRPATQSANDIVLCKQECIRGGWREAFAPPLRFRLFNVSILPSPLHNFSEYSLIINLCIQMYNPYMYKGICVCTQNTRALQL